MQNLRQDPLPDQLEDLRREVAEVVLDPDRWLVTPNDQLGGREPLDLARSGDEGRQMVRDLIEAIKHGMTT
jgi:uncharacterized protein (DUF2384 family)